ncbi:MAG: hypothetical protein OEM38_09045, partial [Gammaproteobacteria bacterium]|nr:hypothetical protein [Gammaproteobacteria bacterium]
MPNSIESAAKLYESGRLDEADSICRQILKKDQNNATALHLRGVIAYQSANYSAAVTLLGAANKLLKNNISIMFALAASHENVQQYELAISLYRKICDVNPENRPARTQLASALEKSHQYKKALAEYGLLNKKFENDPATILALSRLYAGSGCELESKRYAKKLYDLAPENADIWNDLGIVYKNIHCTIDAINCFNKSLSINENHIKSRLNLASLLQETGRNLNAAINYRHVINSTGTNSNELSRAYYNLALIYLGEGDFAAGWKNLVHRPKKFTDIPSITNLNNKRLLILGEEGLGDELTFLRFIPLLKTYGPIIEYISNPKLIPLLEQIKSI